MRGLLESRRPQLLLHHNLDNDRGLRAPDKISNRTHPTPLAKINSRVHLTTLTRIISRARLITQEKALLVKIKATALQIRVRNLGGMRFSGCPGLRELRKVKTAGGI